MQSSALAMAAAEPPPAVVMNPLDATLDILLRENGTVCSKHSEAGYGYLSGGCRANVGLSEGKAHFKVRMLQALLSSDDLPVTHTACIGVSWADAPVQQLGEVRGVRMSAQHHAWPMHPL